MTNRNSTTIAPAYTMICTTATKWAPSATNCTATPNSVSTRPSAAWTGFFIAMTPIAPPRIITAAEKNTTYSRNVASLTVRPPWCPSPVASVDAVARTVCSGSGARTP